MIGTVLYLIYILEAEQGGVANGLASLEHEFGLVVHVHPVLIKLVN